jgi:hypothetical protein
MFNDAVINLRRYCVINPFIYIVVYFAVPSLVEDVFMKPGSHNISINWKIPTLNRYYVTQYVIEWVQLQNGKSDNCTVSENKNQFVIENLEACAEYEVSVRAVNEEGESSGAVTGKTKTETEGKYQI